LRVWDTRTGQPIIAPLEHVTVPWGSVAANSHQTFSPTGRYLAGLANTNDTIVIVDLASRMIGEPLRHDRTVSAATFSPDEHYVATVLSNAVQLWDFKTRTMLGEPLPHRNITRGAVFTRDSARLLTWSRTETNLWDVATARMLIPPLLGGNSIIWATFTSDETRVATFAATRGELRLWDAASGVLLAEPIVGVGNPPASPITFTTNGHFIVTGKPGVGVQALVWPMPPSSGGRDVPSWLLRLATALAGGEIDDRAVFRTREFDAKAFEEIRAELAALPNDAPCAEWGRWFLADRATRPIAPGFTITRVEAAKLATAIAPTAAAAASATPQPVTTPNP
ncbi:MAG: hypothetical protein Q7R41_15420, partial [Phycisphaerales bacterium]|nr:hypothetical protein [Phycisphaerales bacterium]